MNRDDIYERSHLIDALRNLGAVDLEREKRTVGFERRPMSPDRRPKSAPAWGVAPMERE
jgi:hypothetical protein